MLIAVRNSLNLSPKLISSSVRAEIISLELTLLNKQKYTFSTLYRVGTLGNLNAKEVETHFTRIFRSRKYKCNFIIGDMNLNSINWLFFYKPLFLSLCDKHIPKITIKESFQPPWFDYEVFRLNKKKELFRKQFKETNDQQ